MNFLCTAASFTVAIKSCGLKVLCQLTSSLRLQDVLVHQLANLLAASSRPTLTDKPLPFASSYRLITTWFSTVIFLQGTFTPLVHAHAGRTQGQQSDAYRAPSASVKIKNSSLIS
jgi:hypothetical protein